MHKTWITFLTLSISALFAPLAAAQDTPAATPDQSETFTLPAGKTIELDYYLPDGFDAHKAYPVILAPGSFFLQDDPAVFGWVVVRAYIGDRNLTTQNANAVLDHISKTVDPRGNKFYIMGYSANSGGVFRVAATLPNRFAGILTIPGHPRQQREFTQVKHMKIRFIVGEQDSYWLREAKAAHGQLLGLGADTNIEIIENGGHCLNGLNSGFVNFKLRAIVARTSPPTYNLLKKID